MSRSTLLGSATSQDLVYEEDTENKENFSKSNQRVDLMVKSKNTNLIEEFLTNFLQHATPHHDHHTKKKISNTQLNVHVLDFEIDRVELEFVPSALSDIYSLKVRYQIARGSQIDGDEKIGFFIVKLPPSLVEDRELAAISSVQQREILFYTKTMVDIEEWCKRNTHQINFSFTRCYYAHFDRPLEKHAVTGLLENLTKAESMIILEDLRPQGFGKRHYVEPLNLSEVRTALLEIAKIHCTTWAMQEMEEIQLKKKWPFFYKPEFMAMFYEAMLENGFPKLEKHLRQLVETNRDLDAAKILARLSIFRSTGMRDILTRLLQTANYPAPNCLIHMDYWADNVFFRNSDPDFPDPTTLDDASKDLTNLLLKSVQGSELTEDGQQHLDCRIIDWQMMSIGRPTHDIALLLLTSLPLETRREKSASFLEFYWTCFQSMAAKFELNLPFDLSCLQEEFKGSQLLAVLQIISSCNLALADQTSQERLMGALLDLITMKII